MAKITYNNPAAFAINDTVKELINRVADDTVNPEVVITSTLRSPEAQAKAMADNLYAGKRIRYRAPGAAVVKVFDDNCKKQARSEVEKLMVAEIKRQAHQSGGLHYDQRDLAYRSLRWHYRSVLR